MSEETLKEPMTLSDERIETLETLKPLILSADQTYGPNSAPYKGEGKINIQTLLHNIKPKLFIPRKNLHLENFDQVLKKLELFEFSRIEFDPIIRNEYLVELVSNYDPIKKRSYVNGFRINVTKNHLARGLKLPIKKRKNNTANSNDEVDLYSEVYTDDEIGFIEDFVFNWMLVGHKDMITPSEIVESTRCIRDRHPEKMDAAKLIWYKVEKELTQGDKLVECYYASHLQCLIRSQRPLLFFDYDDYVGNEVVTDMSNENSGDKERTQPQTITQVEPVEPVPYTDTVVSLSRDELSNEARAAKRLKSTLVENLGNKTDRELLEFIWMNKRNVGILEQKLPEKAEAIKEAIKYYEDEIEHRARLQRPKENATGPVTCTTPEVDYELLAPYENVGDNMVEDGSAVGGENTRTPEDMNQEKTCPQVENVKLVIKVEEGEQSVSQNESIDVIIAEEECAATLQTVPVNGDKNQASTQDICAGLKKVSCVLSMLSSPNLFYTPQGNPLDEEAEKAKQALIQLLGKNFETIVGSPDEEMVKSCVKILTNNLHKLPRVQGQVIETLNTEFDSACQNWEMCHTSHQSNIAFEVQQGDNLGVLKKWQEQDMEIESKLETVDADIRLLKAELRVKEAELRVKELTRESLVKEKSDLFDQSKMSIDEAEKLLQEMVTVKLQSNVAVKNMKELAEKWERTREL